MKLKTLIDPTLDEDEVVIYARERTAAIAELESRIESFGDELIGYDERGVGVPITVGNISAFSVDGGKLYAITASGNLRLRERLHIVESRFGADFMRINQSCIVRVTDISRFYASVGGALCIELKCGYSDYVSRRQVRAVKKRMGV